MRRTAAIALGLAILASSSGCRQSASPATSAVKAAKPAVASPTPDTSKKSETAAVVKAASQSVSTVSDNAPSAQAVGESGKSLDKDRSKDRGARERVAVLTLGGPLVIDAWLTTDGRSHVEAFDEQMREVLDAADVDKDGRPTWKELAGNESYLEGKLPNGSPIGDRLAEMWTDRYDLNRDRKIARVEVAAWLGRDAGRSARAFEVRSTRSFFPNPRATSRVWQLLDADRDGQLSNEELQAAPAKLWLLDADDDRMIAPPELATLRELLEAVAGQMSQTSREAARDAAIHLEPRFDADRLEYVLIDLYAPRQALRLSSFSEVSRVFASLDADRNELIHRDELAELANVEPHLELRIDFGMPESSGEAVDKLELVSHAPELNIIAQPSSDRLVISLGRTRLVVSAHDFVTPQAANQTYPPRQLRLMVHDQCDAVGEELDANGDGLLGEREIDSIPDRLLKRDLDGDGAITPRELPYWLIVAYLRGERPAERSFYQPALAIVPGSNSESPSWFSSADFNGDGDISRREFLGSLEKFSQLDANGDGYISGAEASQH